MKKMVRKEVRVATTLAYQDCKKTQASRIQVTMLGTNDGEENLNFPRITSSQLRQI